MMLYVLDACALLSLLRNEPGADSVATTINAANNGEARIIMNKVNLLEVFYDLYRTLGEEKACFILDEIKKRPIEINAEISDAIFNEAGRLKATYRISLADSFVVAQAIVSNGTLLTSDHHELDLVEKTKNIDFCWIR